MSFHLFVIPLIMESVAAAPDRGATDSDADLFAIGFDDGVGPQRGRQLPGKAINAWIIQQRNSVTLQCVGRASAEKVSWWYYPCPEGRTAVERIHLTRDVVHKHPEYYELLTSRTGGVISSSLRVKNLEVSGLYRCGWQRAESKHYFIVGRKTSLCFRFESLLKTIRSFVGAVEDGADTYEYVLKLPRGEAGTHDYRIRFSLPGNSRSPGTRVSSDDDRKSSLHVIKFDESDAVGVKG